jgi:hypothetical protein
MNTHQKAKKWLPDGSQKTLNCLGHSTSLVKDNLSIDRIAAGITPDGTIFSAPAGHHAFNIRVLARTA